MFYIITNLFSGRKRKQNKNIHKIFDYLDSNKIEYVNYYTEYYKHPYEIACNITKENDSGNIIVIGGDGTLNEVINGISDFSKWNIAIIPTG